MTYTITWIILFSLTKHKGNNMAVIKKKGITWKEYARALAESNSKVSHFDKIELSGLLLARDMDNDYPPIVLDKIFAKESDVIGFLISNYMLAESQDTAFDLNEKIKSLVTEYYSAQIDELVKEEERAIEEERKNSHPNDEPTSDEVYEAYHE